MSTVDCFADDAAVGTSSCPATDVIMVVVDNPANGVSALPLPGLTPATTVSTAAGTSSVSIEAYAMIVEHGIAQSSIFSALVASELVLSALKATSTITAGFNQLALSTANIEDQIALLDIPEIVEAGAEVVSSIVSANTVAVFQADETAHATSFVGLGLEELCVSGATGQSMVVLLRRIEDDLVATANATSSTPTASNVPQDFLLISTAGAKSVVSIDVGATTIIEATAQVQSCALFRNPAAIAWVMNTETAAANWYNNFDFESIIQPPGMTLAIGPDGLYELTGDYDDGVNIQAIVESGFTDFGVAQTKRVEAMYFGYTSSGQISAKVEVAETGTPYTYVLEDRLTPAPRNSRIKVAKGISGRYWRMTFENVDGASFEVHDATVDVAISNRRV